MNSIDAAFSGRSHHCTDKGTRSLYVSEAGSTRTPILFLAGSDNSVVYGTFGVPGSTRTLGAISHLVRVSCKTILAGFRLEQVGFKRALRTVLRMRTTNLARGGLQGNQNVRSYFNFPISGTSMSFGHYVRLGRVTTEHAIARLEGLLAITEKLETFRAAQLFLRSKVWAHFTLPRGKRVGNFNKLFARQLRNLFGWDYLGNLKRVGAATAESHSFTANRKAGPWAFSTHLSG